MASLPSESADGIGIDDDHSRPQSFAKVKSSSVTRSNSVVILKRFPRHRGVGKIMNPLTTELSGQRMVHLCMEDL